MTPPRGATASEETRAKLAAAARERWKDPAARARQSQTLKGRGFSDEHRANISAAAKRRPGRPHTAETRAKMSIAQSGENHPNWSGDEIGYTAAHNRSHKALAGRPCAHADETCKGRLEAAFRHDAPDEFVKTVVRDGHPHRYSTRVEDYMALCKSHHVRYDNPRNTKTHCRNGHEFTPENTRISPKGYRYCATCQRRAKAEWDKRRMTA